MIATPNSSTTAPSPSTPTTPTVAAEVQAPFSFTISARGGTPGDCQAAILAALQDLRADGLIGPAAREDGEAA